MKVMLFEPAFGGHHLSSYVRYVLREMKKRNWQPCLVTTRRAGEHQAFGICVEEAGGDLDAVFVADIPETLRYNRIGLLNRQMLLHQWYRRAFAAASRQYPADMHLIMSFDSIDRAVGLFGSPFGDSLFSAISIGLRYHWPKFSIARRRLFDGVDARLIERAFQNPNLRRVFVIDEHYKRYAADSVPLKRKIHHVHDPGKIFNPIDRRTAKARLNLDPEIPTILVYGVISREKAIRELIECAADLARSGRPVSVLIAGECDASARSILRSSAGEELLEKNLLLVRDYFQTQAQETLVFSAADAVWVAYEPSFLKLSGVMVQATSAGAPIIARDCGLIGLQVKNYDLGVLLPRESSSQVRDLILKSVSDRDARQTWQENCARFAAESTPERFGRTICDGLLRRPGDG